MNVLLCLSHSIEEYDQLRLFHELGYGVASIGSYIDPAHPHDDKRPPLPEVPAVASVIDAVDKAGGNDFAQKEIPQAVLDWLGDDGVIIFHHYLERLGGQWPRIRDWKQGSPERRVIWRTVGQSTPDLEWSMGVLRRQGVEVVRYSPKERNMPGYCGEDALIRFYKDPDEWQGWTGEERAVLNITQNLRGRHPFTNWIFWEQVTQGMPRTVIGPQSEELQGGRGVITTEEMKAALRSHRVYLYTGTQPASYTLGLIEAMMTGIPVISIGPDYMQVFEYGPGVFEGHEIAGLWSPTPSEARGWLQGFLDNTDAASKHGAFCRERAISLFGKAAIASQWQQFLGSKVLA